MLPQHDVASLSTQNAFESSAENVVSGVNVGAEVMVGVTVGDADVVGANVVGDALGLGVVGRVASESSESSSLGQ